MPPCMYNLWLHATLHRMSSTDYVVTSNPRVKHQISSKTQCPTQCSPSENIQRQRPKNFFPRISRVCTLVLLPTEAPSTLVTSKNIRSAISDLRCCIASALNLALLQKLFMIWALLKIARLLRRWVRTGHIKRKLCHPNSKEAHQELQPSLTILEYKKQQLCLTLAMS